MEAWVDDIEQLKAGLAGAGLEVQAWQDLATSPSSGRQRVRFIAG